MTDRSQYTQGLRVLADLLDEHPDIPVPAQGGFTSMSICFLRSTNDNRALLANAVRAFPGTMTKNVHTGESANYYGMEGTLGGPNGLRVSLTAFREEVCERVVTGTREVTTEVPDAAALAAVPTVSVTKVVEDVEWVCRPLLATGVTA